ncbi:MAG TPA: hypothetical protein VFA65_19540 [Bryobacteraceae bacterium]|nr:hypothetical protein [Bryobacteraceae bacterium]
MRKTSTTKRPKRFIVSPDSHNFVGRIYDLSVVGMYFESYDEVIKYSDAKYVLGVNERTTLLARRVESLNHVGDLLWPEPPIQIETLPISAYDFCNLIQDAFLMRTISILDCCCLLAVEVLELNIKPRDAKIEKIKNLSANHPCCAKLQALSDLQQDLRTERNVRFHRGEEETLTDDDTTFQMVARFKYIGQGMKGTDRHGREINLKRSYDEAINRLRKKFRVNIKGLSSSLDDFYDELSREFEKRFRIKFRAEGSFGHIHGVFGDK